MKGMIISLYGQFRCLAGECTSTCCSGWKIVVDDKAYDRFCGIQDKVLRDDILSNICQGGGVKYFANRSGGRCAMLDDDGLCRIQRNTDGKMLCNTCRKFPRLVMHYGGLLWISMAASCPVTADYIVNSKTGFNMLGNNGNISAASLGDIPFIAGEMQEFKKRVQEFVYVDRKEKDYINMYKLFMDIADNVLGVIIESREIHYLDGCFDYFQEEKSALKIISQFAGFDNLVKERWGRVFENYAQYRIFSRFPGQPDEKREERLSQVSGEMVLIYITVLSRHYTLIPADMENKLPDSEEWKSAINWVYRMCVHNMEAGKKLHKIFQQYISTGNKK